MGYVCGEEAAYFFERAPSFPSDFNGMKKGLVRDKPQHFYYIIKSAFCKYVSGN
jgi:hypothetical protein